ncbi:carbonic anhydrase 1-like [Bolinopsis microptera]|uniref:carbonic anhydrase 1-like n=1 Tax=Bolinopsis microptera TaxID=2820187 RepID=UPI00307A4092
MFIGRVLSKTCIRSWVSSEIKTCLAARHCSVTTNTAGMGERQSPIDLVGAIKATLPPLKITFENGPDRANLVAINTGQTLHIDCAGQILGKLTGGPVGDSNYTLQQFHFHWGDNAQHGSEHKIEGEFSSAELHFVFKNEKYGTVGEAASNGDGLAVAGVMIKESKAAKDIVLPELFEIVPQLKTNKGSSGLKDTLDLASALPANRAYFTYLGSLTTPQYNECVTWIVYKDEVEVSSWHMNQLRGMKDTEGSEILNNWREVQDIAGRQIKLVSE